MLAALKVLDCHGIRRIKIFKTRLALNLPQNEPRRISPRAIISISPRTWPSAEHKTASKGTTVVHDGRLKVGGIPDKIERID